MANEIYIGPISGFPEYTEPEAAKFAEWQRITLRSYTLHGFVQITPRPLESRGVLAAKGGIQHQVFGVSRLPSDSPTDLALPFDRTVPFARWVAAQAGSLVFPVRRADIGFSFRGERAQAGRFQGFVQADVDIVAPQLTPLDDADCIATIVEALTALDVGTFSMKLSHLRLVRALLAHYGVPQQHQDRALRALDSVSASGISEVVSALSEATGAEGAALTSLVEILLSEGDASSVRAKLPQTPSVLEAFGEFERMLQVALELGVPDSVLQISLRIARGLDYYTGTVFETHLSGAEQFGSIASGGRYDNLAEALGGRSLPGVGGSIGLTRLFDIALRTGRLKPARRTHAVVLVGARTPEEMRMAIALTASLRGHGIATELAAANGVRGLLNYANKKGHTLAVVAMAHESIVVRHLSTSEQQDVATIEAAVDAVRHHHKEQR